VTATEVMGTGSAGPAPRTVLRIIEQLADRLAGAGIRYCHWKSNEAMDRSLRGDNDLDLLVAAEDAGRFLAVLHELGFRIARTTRDRDVPGIVDLFGLDEETATVVHAQAHFRLAVGDDMTKNVHLPVEHAYLASCRRDGVLPVPDPAFEYLVFLLRMGIKHCPLPGQIGLQGRLTLSERRELHDLETQVDPMELERLRAVHLPVVPAALLARCREAIAPGSGRLKRASVGRALLRTTAPYARRPPVVDVTLRLWRRPWRRLQARSSRSDTRRRAGSGGVFVAVVGGDGSGKSTTVAALAETVGEVLVTRTGHLGKPPCSLSTRLGRRLLRPRGGAPSPGLAHPPWDPPATTFPGYGYLVWHVLNARDRAREHRRLRRASRRGAVVVCDRVPLPAISFMDAPRTAGVPGLEHRPVGRALVRAEARYYRTITAPDLTIVLRVPPSVAVARRPEQDRRYVHHRAAEVAATDWAAPGIVVIDAARPLEDVLRDARRAVWNVL
jgi:thymidylate kinase